MPTVFDEAFAVAGRLAILGWLSLVLLPRWRGLSAALAGWIVPGLLSLGYLVLIAVYWHAAKGGFASLDSVAALFASSPRQSLGPGRSTCPGARSPPFRVAPAGGAPGGSGSRPSQIPLC